MVKTKTTYLFFLFGMIFASSCVEPYDFETETFERALVVEARMTDELKQQEVKLSMTHMLEEDGPDAERNATVRVLDNTGMSFEFEETEAGRYGSIDSFAIQPNKEYQLNIRLANGRSYVSAFEATPASAKIDRVYAERGSNQDGFEGLNIYIDASTPNGNAKYFRYQYEETYKLIVPEWKPRDIVVLENTGGGLEFCLLGTTQRPQEQITCYVSPSRKNSNVLNIDNSSTGNVIKHPVRFIADNNYKMASRYSILVRQLVQTRDANAYFETLDNFTSAGSLFSQLQTGYIQGNITSEANPEERVIGYFEVSTLDTKRFFFNYDDFYQGELPPPYFVLCEPYDFEYQITTIGCGPTFQQLIDREIIYHSEMPLQPNELFPEFKVVKRLCGDCTAAGTPEIPEFWTE